MANPILKLGLPKGSLEDPTIDLFDRAGWKVRKHPRNYFPDINDPEITARLCRVQEIPLYIQDGVLDLGLTGKDWVKETKADVVVVNGLGLEGWLDRLIKASGFKGELVVASKGVKTHTLDEEGKTVTDPHAWNSAANGALYAQNILDGLVKADPEDKAALTSSGKHYIDQLTSLDGWAKAQFSAIPLAKRKVLTSHDAFGYFGRAYHVTFLAPQGLSSESEASAAQVAALIKQIKADGVHTWFMENQLDPRLVKQIASATGAQPGGELYPEALSKPGGVADSYVKMMRHNVELIANSMK